MPKVSYSQEQREKIRSALISTGLSLMAKQGIRRTTVGRFMKPSASRAAFFTPFSRPKRI